MLAAAGFVLMLAAVGISHYQIMCHLRNYTEPLFQRYIIRILYMVPVYAVGSWCSLKWHDSAIYFDTIRDCYEAYVIYNFMALLLAYVGGPGAVVVGSEGKIVHPSWVHMTCCLPAMPVDGFFLRRCKQCCLQFVLAKPVMAALTLLLYAAGAYTDGEMSPSNGYFYISIAYNVCYTLALMGLVLFWNGASELLAPFNPLLKFVVVKTVVFLTFWQGLVISAVHSARGDLGGPEQGKELQNFTILAEMVLAAIGMLYGFPHAEYSYGGAARGFRVAAFAHAVSVRDVVADVAHAFGSLYSDYVLYTDGGPASNVKRKKYRGHKQDVPSAAAEVPAAAKAGAVSAAEQQQEEEDADPTIASLINARLIKKLAERLAAMDAAAAARAAEAAGAPPPKQQQQQAPDQRRRQGQRGGGVRGVALPPLPAAAMVAAAAQGKAALEGGARAARRLAREELERAAQAMEMHRNAAILVDSDSDGLDEDEDERGGRAGVGSGSGGGGGRDGTFGGAGFGGGRRRGEDSESDSEEDGSESDDDDDDEEEEGGGRIGAADKAAAAACSSASASGDEEGDDGSDDSDDRTSGGARTTTSTQSDDEDEKEADKGPPAVLPSPSAATLADDKPPPPSPPPPVAAPKLPLRPPSPPLRTARLLLLQPPPRAAGALSGPSPQPLPRPTSQPGCPPLPSQQRRSKGLGASSSVGSGGGGGGIGVGRPPPAPP